MEALLDEKQVAERLNVALPTLRNWRSLGRGPNWCRIGARAVRYAPSEIEKFIARGMVETQGGAA